MRNKTLFSSLSRVNWLHTGSYRIPFYKMLVTHYTYNSCILLKCSTLHGTVQCQTGFSLKPARRANNVQTGIVWLGIDTHNKFTHDH